MFKVELLSGAGGVGKTTIALCLASYWVKEGAKVAMLDLDESKQLTDVIKLNNFGIKMVELEMEAADCDFLIIDNAPSTKTPSNDPDVIVYPMLPHQKSIRALERAKKMIKTDNIIFVANKFFSRKTIHRENAKIIKNLYNGSQIKDLSFYEKVMEYGGNVFDLTNDRGAKNEISLLAQRIEQFI